MIAFSHTIQPAVCPYGHPPVFSCLLAPGMWILGAGGHVFLKLSEERLQLMSSAALAVARFGPLGWFIDDEWRLVAGAFPQEFEGIDLA